ncbi:hypothetical protein COCNU_scaffold010649G000010 [Cocos nucifera]|nr:hypothetical protein [Cocos nucifera]
MSRPPPSPPMSPDQSTQKFQKEQSRAKTQVDSRFSSQSLNDNLETGDFGARSRAKARVDSRGLSRLEVVFDKLASLALQEFGSLWGIEHELNRLRHMLLKIFSIIKDTKMREIRDQSLKMWLKELKDAAYNANDILDEFEAEALR